MPETTTWLPAGVSKLAFRDNCTTVLHGARRGAGVGRQRARLQSHIVNRSKQRKPSLTLREHQELQSSLATTLKTNLKPTLDDDDDDDDDDDVDGGGGYVDEEDDEDDEDDDYDEEEEEDDDDDDDRARIAAGGSRP